MSKKPKARWGEHGVIAVEEFKFDPKQASLLGSLLGITKSDEVSRLKLEFEEIADAYLCWSAQDEQGPTRAQRNAALRELAETSQRLELLLKGLDYASENELIDALAPYPPEIFNHIGTRRGLDELGFSQIEALRHRLTHFNRCLGSLLKRCLRQRGPQPKKTLPEIIGMLAAVYERETGSRVTHNPYAGVGDYKGVPQSPAGQFMAKFFEIVDPKLPATSIATELARSVSRY